MDELKLSSTNLLTHNRAYSYIGSNGALVADPGVVHFGGFELGKVFRQVIRIINTSPVSRRLHVIPPTTPNFKVGIASCMHGHCIMMSFPLSRPCARTSEACWPQA